MTPAVRSLANSSLSIMIRVPIQSAMPLPLSHSAK